jgi:DNA modification methylase
MNPVRIGDCELWLGDCMEILPTLGKVDAVITDPPYGIGEADGKNKTRGSAGGANKWKGSRNTTGVGVASTDFGDPLEWDSAPPSAELIAAVLSAGEHAVLFGGNYFPLPPSSCWLVWDKVNGTTDFADCELAWTNLPKAVRLLRWMWNGMLQQDMANKEERVHPTQKPAAVMKWCIEQVGQAETILDPFMGSGTTGVAAVQLGRKFIGIEREPKYFEIACRRIEQAYAQRPLFDAPQPKKPEQMEIA